MTAIARSLFAVRRQAHEFGGVLIAAGFAGMLAMGAFSGAMQGRVSLLSLSAMAVFGVALARAVWRELSRPAVAAAGTAEEVREFELGTLLIVGSYLLLALFGGTRSFLYPLAYALVSFLAIVHRRRWIGAAWIGVTVVLELALARASGPGVGPLVALHLTWLAFFAAGNSLVLASVTRRLRGAHHRAMRDELARVRQEARDFRLIASQLPLASRAERSREEEELRMAHGAVHAVHEQLYFTIDLLCSSLDLHTCALLWARNDQPTDARGTPQLVIKEMATASEFVASSPELESAGMLAGALRDPKPICLKSLGGRRVPPYYDGPERVSDLCVVPLKEGAAVRGLLCADRKNDRPFEPAEVAVLEKAADQILRIIEQERSFAAVEREKYEQEQFYAASELLNQALTVEDVHAKTFAAVARIAPYDLAVVTSYDAHARRHEVIAVSLAAAAAEHRAWERLPAQLNELVFPDGPGLVSMAVKNRHYMPASTETAEREVVVFDEGTKIEGAKSLLVLPLSRGDQVSGTLVLASRRSRAYGAQTREMLRVIGHQVGVSLQNARMYQSMEERATTDGLTGLTNHRCFQERLEHLHALAERTGQKYALILTDVDHFKGVNDTYGHPAGDAVLRRVAALFTGRARKVDIVARYGGEEFVIVLPDTDGEGAALFANRLREELAEQVMNSEHGNFSVTISMGIAEFPRDAASRADLIDRADKALYWSKEHGRNRVTRYCEMA